MSWWSGGFRSTELSRPTPILGLRLWVVLGIVVVACIVLALFFLPFCLTSRRRRRPSPPPHSSSSRPLKVLLHDATPAVSKEILEIAHPPPAAATVHVDVGKPEHHVVLPSPPSASTTTGTTSGGSRSTEPASVGTIGGGRGALPGVTHLWGQPYSLRELEEATNGLAEENVVGEGGYGIVYRGQLADGTVVAIKNLLNNRGQAEKEFRVEVEAIGRVRHKNLVQLLGYCVDGAYRMLVYEFVDNGNLDQWLHGYVGEVSPLTWEIRMNIIVGTAQGLAYLHEGLEPKVVHRDVKSSNILLDRQWNPKVSDFGLAKLLCSERSYVTTRVMGTFGYVAPEYASTGMLNERSDVYSFGVLIMEIISGRAPVDYTRPPGEVNLVEWLKTMVGNKKCEQVVDPKMPERPSSKALKRALLVALRCVDPDASKRLKMGNIIHMLQVDDLLFHDDRKLGKESSSLDNDYRNDKQRLDRYNINEEERFRYHDNQRRWHR